VTTPSTTTRVVRYAYLGDRMTAPALRLALCAPVLNARGKCISGRSAMLVRFDGERAPRVVLRRMLRRLDRLPVARLPSRDGRRAHALLRAPDKRLRSLCGLRSERAADWQRPLDCANDVTCTRCLDRMREPGTRA
jgi:hypothetical protein